MSVRITFEVKQTGPHIDLRLITETTRVVTEREKAIGKVAKDYLDAFIASAREAAEDQGIEFTHTKEGA